MYDTLTINGFAGTPCSRVFHDISPLQDLLYGIIHFMVAQIMFNLWLNCFSETIYLDFIKFAAEPIQNNFDKQNQIENHLVCMLVCIFGEEKAMNL